MEIRTVDEKDTEILLKNDTHISEKELKNLINLGRVYIAEENGDFVGWLRYNLFWDNTPFMNMLYVLSEYRGRGYGRELVDYWEMQMKNKGFSEVMTSTLSDEYAQHFYNKLGYNTVGGFTPSDGGYELILMKKIK